MRSGSTPKEGDDLHIKGFILNKLYLGGYFWRPGGRHGKHTSVDNLPKGYRPRYGRRFRRVIRELRSGGFIVIFKSVGEEHVCAVLEPEIVERGLEICNEFRNAVGLPSLDRSFRPIPD